MNAGTRFGSRVTAGLALCGIDLGQVRSTVGGARWYRDDLRRWKELAGSTPEFALGRPFPMLGDRVAGAGNASGHYFHQDLLVAQRVAALEPRRHVDVGSRIDGFVAHVAAFRHIDVVDIRPLGVEVPNIGFVRADLMAGIPAELVGSTDSLSCLHALEHFGLGRYGDPLDPDGHRKGLASLAALLEPGGRLHLGVPIGPQRVEFNAHRVFSVAHLLDLVAPDFTLDRISYVDDAGALVRDADPEQGRRDNWGCHYGCGIAELVRRAPT
ncbi:MAG: DUF268 domain-containing protein [Microthrixaceae bacterium]